jgi:hypothetical protein
MDVAVNRTMLKWRSKVSNIARLEGFGAVPAGCIGFMCKNDTATIVPKGIARLHILST